MAEPLYVCFSGGKDSLMMLHQLTASGDYEVVKLVTTITAQYARISMHGVRLELLRAQAAALGFPLLEIGISPGADNCEYETAMSEVWDQAVRSGIRRVAFGDIFLEDLKEYRKKQLAKHKLACLFPIWGRDTSELVRKFIDLGYRAITTCIDPRKLDETFVGRKIDYEFLNELPPHVDPCGENGEFHSFVFDGPRFYSPVGCVVGKTVERDSFLFVDLVPQ